MRESIFFTKFPSDDGFKMPGEFHEHECCYMIWPFRPDNWRDFGRPAQKAFVEVAIAISKFEKVKMVVSKSQRKNAENMLPDFVEIIEIESDDAWMRDVGPTFVKNEDGIVRGIDWIFNAWGGLEGGLYFPWDNDDLLAGRLLEIEGVDGYRAPFVLEGGAIHVDGEGTLITTRECLLNENRNPQLDENKIEKYLKKYLGVEKIIWIEKGVFNDETDGHIDNLLCFSKPGQVLLTWTDDQDDPQYKISQNAYDVLIREKDAKGRSLDVIKIHQPNPIYLTDMESKGVISTDTTHPRQVNDRMAASYINHYIANGGVIMPIFQDEFDDNAMSILKEVYKGREIVPVYAREILLGGGNIHCITQQRPK